MSGDGNHLRADKGFRVVTTFNKGETFAALLGDLLEAF